MVLVVNFYVRIYFFWSVDWINPFLLGYQTATISFVVFILYSGVWYIFEFDESPFMIFCFALMRILSKYAGWEYLFQIGPIRGAVNF